MSATFNWAYKPGVANKYGIIINESADDVRPDNAVYVALFGNDVTGNGSRMYPYRTITKAATLGDVNLVLGSGVYRETAIITSMSFTSIIGDGDVVIDISYNGSLTSVGMAPIGLYNLTIRGNGTSTITKDIFFLLYTDGCVDCVFDGTYITNSTNNDVSFSDCVFKNYSGLMVFGSNGNYPQRIVNCTFINCNNIQTQHNIHSLTIPITSTIFYNCNLSFDTITDLAAIRYSLFFKSNFKMTQGQANGDLLYPSVPDGFSYYSFITDLQSAYLASYSTQSLPGCIIADPKFNNPDIGDFTLAFDSPAKNLSYLGTYVGARSVAYKINAATGGGAFDLDSAINITVADDSIQFTDETIDAQIDTTVIPNIIKRELARIPSYGINADRNGQYIDSIPDLSSTSISPGTDLTEGLPYLVENGAIEYNGASLADGDRFTTVTGVVAFTSSAGGTVREILEAPQRHTIMMRFSDGEVLSGSTNLTLGYWYYASGTITHNGTDYSDQSFKATANSGFSGSGIVEFCFNSTDGWQHYEPGIRPTSNNVGDARLGAILRGNGDPNYDRGGIGIKEFPINAKYIQARYFLKSANLKP